MLKYYLTGMLNVPSVIIFVLPPAAPVSLRVPLKVPLILVAVLLLTVMVKGVKLTPETAFQLANEASL